jgi:hypothetical protein
MNEPTEGETWDEMAARVSQEEISNRYAQSLWASMNSYRTAGFSDAQAWELTLFEHRSRLEFMTQSAMADRYSGRDEDDAPGP